MRRSVIVTWLGLSPYDTHLAHFIESELLSRGLWLLVLTPEQ